MQAELSLKAAFYRARQHHHKTWRRIVTVLASIVVFCTTYALILPAITMEPDYICGLEAHIHEDVCYQLPEAAPVTTMVCDPTALGFHEHTEDCYTETGELRCGIADFVLHTHSDDCYDAHGEPVCPLLEIEEHIHTTDGCWQQPHVHEELCYTKHQGELLCAIQEGFIHSHEDACYIVRQNWLCQLEEAAPHTHNDACYTQTQELTCKLEVTEGHAHSDTCYDEFGNPVCGLPEIAGHAHTGECYQVNETFTCKLEETEGHTHSEACYEMVSELTCTQEAGIPHAHGETCYAWTSELTCTQLTAAEGAVSTLICDEQQLYVHTHEPACYDQSGALICGLLEVSEHTHGGSCFAVTYEQPTEPVLGCGLEVHEHAETCLPEEETADSVLDEDVYCGLAEHTHLDACWAEDDSLMCTMTVHTHEELCWLAPSDTSAVETEEEWLADLPELTYDIAADLIAVAESQLGYEESDINYIVTEDGDILYYSRYADWWSYGENPYGDWNAKFVAFCLENAGIPSSLVPVEPETATWPNVLATYDQWRDNDGTFAPITADLVFFDTDNDGTADRAGIITEVDTENSTIRVILERRGLVQEVHYDLDDGDILGYARIPGNEPATIESSATAEDLQAITQMIETLPSYEEIEAQMLAYEEAEDWDSYDAYLQDVSLRIKQTHGYYEFFDSEDQALISNRQKLLELEMFWAPLTYALTDTVNVSAVNSFKWSDSAGNPAYGGALIVYDADGTTIADVGMGESAFRYWHVYVIEKENGQYVVQKIYTDEVLTKKTVSVSGTGFILICHFGTLGASVDASVGDYVSLSSDFWKTTTAYSGTVLGSVTFSESPATTRITSAEPTVVRSASTSDFVELNLYDYNYNINNYWDPERGGDTKYPGFQWNGGAYYKSTDSDYYTSNTSADDGVPDIILDRNYIDAIDFGNSLITNHAYATPSTGAYGKSATATGVGKLYNNSGASSTGKINWLWYSGGSAYETTTNRPVGLSTGYQSIANTLKDGYPALLDGTSLSYLFGDGDADTANAVTKQNTANIDGLFQQDETTGAYYYNSRWNHAQYSNNEFTLYKEIITPNFITYPFGNFLPLNSITNLNDATQVGAFNYNGGVQDYVENIMAYLAVAMNDSDTYGDTSRSQLITMLEEYRENWKYYPWSSGVTWSNLSAANAIRDYFTGANAGDGDSPSADTGFVTQAHLDNMYNIDWDVATNFFFGMDMEMRFYQPKNGMTGNDTNNDGEPDYPMEFYFTGDDDVWVFIDDVLFLDLTGIHRHVGGKIDFVNGWVYYYELDVENGGDVSSTPYAQYSFAAILRAAGWTEAQIDEVLKPINSAGNRPFKDYSTHTFNFFYMERGSGSSVCRLNFNFPLLRQNTLSVGKELTDDSADIEAIGNPDFLFQVLDVDENGNKTNNPFLPDGWAYSLYDVDGSLLQEIVVNSKYPDGRVKEMVIKDASGTVICTETYDDDGTRTLQTGSGTDKVLRIGENGIFKLKAGQRAEFVGIPESAGKYYVRELLDNLDLSQYESITVSGEAATKNENLAIGGTTFTGLESPILDMTNGSSTFRFNNNIDTKKFGSLKITKYLEVGKDNSVSTLAATPTTPEFTFYVTLDGVPLPEGTEYTVTGETDPRTVGDAGHITIPAGKTATISHILSGSKFEVTEIGAAEAGYTVKYVVDGTVSTTGNATGVIREESQVAVDITNYTGVESVEIPVIKNLTMADATRDLTFQFDLVQVTDSTGETEVDPPTTDSITVTLESGTTQNDANHFTLTYDGIETTKLPVVYYYKITEVQGDTKNVVYDPSVYVVEVSITASDGAKITGVWKDKVAVDGSSVAFTNTIIPTGDLKLEKQVKGTSDLSGEFSFTITLKDGDTVLTDSFTCALYSINPDTGELEETTDTVGGQFNLSGFKHGEYIIIHDIPIGTKWTITETDNDGYAVTYTVNDGEVKNGAESTGSISTGDTVVKYTNTALYELPETGGGGVVRFLVCGGVLMAFPLLLLGFGRRRRHRGRRVQGG